jgi:hypothetical protein
LTGFVSGDSICSVKNLDPFDVAAEKIWQEIKQHRRVYFPTARNFFPNTLKDFSPNSFWVIERLFQNPDERKLGGLICCQHDAQTFLGKDEREQIGYKLGAYLGEVVRRYHSKIAWGDELSAKRISLQPSPEMPFQNPLFPIKLIMEQLEHYTQGSFVEWGRKEAHLKIDDCPSVSSAP